MRPSGPRRGRPSEPIAFASERDDLSCPKALARLATSLRESPVLDRIVTGVRGLLAVTRTASALLLIASVAINFGNIIGRYFFSVSIPWAEVIMLFLMVGCVFTGCCAVAWEGRQIRMDVVLMMLPDKLRECIHVFSELVMLAAAGAVTV